MKGSFFRGVDFLLSLPLHSVALVGLLVARLCNILRFALPHFYCFIPVGELRLQVEREDAMLKNKVLEVLICA